MRVGVGERDGWGGWERGTGEGGGGREGLVRVGVGERDWWGGGWVGVGWERGTGEGGGREGLVG